MLQRTHQAVRAISCAVLIHWTILFGEARAQAPESSATPAPAPPLDALARATSTPYRPAPGGSEVAFNLEDANLAELTQHIATLTGRRFIFGPKLRGIEVSVVSPVKVSVAEAYEAFLCILSLNGLAVVPRGQFLEIIESGAVVASAPPLSVEGAAVPDSGARITHIYRMKHASASEAAGLLGHFKSAEGDITVYAPRQALIITDTGQHVRRLLALLDEIDVGTAEAKLWVEPIQYASAKDIVAMVSDVFGIEQGASRSLVRVIADEPTNRLLIVGSPEGYASLLALLRRIDTAPAAEGRLHVVPLQHAAAEELESTLTRLLSSKSAASPSSAPGQRAPALPGSFDGAVHVTADKPTNSLIVTSSTRDYAELRRIIDELDRERRQVFIDAVIMEVSTRKTNQLGLAYHGAGNASLFGQASSLLFGGLNVADSIGGSTELQALALGVRGPDVPDTEGLLSSTGLSIPAFGVALNALATSSDNDILSTPHIIALDNTTAEISVGENIPLQINSSGSDLGSLAALLGSSGGTEAASALSGLGSTSRQDVGTRIKITPHINEDNQVRLEIEEEISQEGATRGDLGVVSVVQRSASTTVMVDDEQTVVIGGLVHDALRTAEDKVPLLGDLPLLGFLFRTKTSQVDKTNLVLILTPHVIRSRDDLRRVFARKMEERQEFLDRYFVFNADWQAPADYARTSGLVETIRQTFRVDREHAALEREREPAAPQRHEPSEPLDLPADLAPNRTPASPAATPAAVVPQSAPRAKPAATAPGPLS
jgi:general secretion pathway protein D